MFSDAPESAGLKKVLHELSTYSDETIKICSKKLDKIKISEPETIKMGIILSKNISLNGMPKTEFIKKINRVPPRIRDHKREIPLAHILTTAHEDLQFIDKYTDATETLRTALLHCEDGFLECETWMKENSEKLIESITSLVFSLKISVQLEHSCFTIAIIVYMFRFVFEKQYKRLIGFLVSIIIECCLSVQDYVDQRNQKWSDCHSMSFEQENEPLFHYPQFRFMPNKCQNRLLSVAYFTLSFCFDCITTPRAISRLMTYAINTREVCRLYIVSMFHNVILSLDKAKCKTDPDWVALPLKIHNMIIKFYMDKNSTIRKLIAEINVFIKQCTLTKLPVISKPILETVDIMVQVMKRKKNDHADLANYHEGTEVNAWRKWLDLEKNVTKVSADSDSLESVTSKVSSSKPTVISLTDEDNQVTLSKEEWNSVEHSSHDLLPGQLRQSIILPDLKSIVGLTHLRTQKIQKMVKKIV